MSEINRTNIGPLVDELGDTRAGIAALQRREDELREQVAGLGAGEHRGSRWVRRSRSWIEPCPLEVLAGLFLRFLETQG
jgi:hypothetical protein